MQQQRRPSMGSYGGYLYEGSRSFLRMTIRVDRLVSSQECQDGKEGYQVQCRVDHPDPQVLSGVSESYPVSPPPTQWGAREQVCVSGVADYVHRCAVREMPRQVLRRYSSTRAPVLGPDCCRPRLAADFGVATARALKKNPPYPWTPSNVPFSTLSSGLPRLRRSVPTR